MEHMHIQGPLQHVSTFIYIIIKKNIDENHEHLYGSADTKSILITVI